MPEVKVFGKRAESIMNYRSFNELNEAVRKWVSTFPEDLDLIVGLPRSGLLVANLIALYLNKDLTDLEGFLEGRVLSTGPRCRKDPFVMDKVKKVLIVDDSVSSGAQLEKVRKKSRR